jgi:hypothetical protein
LGDEPDDEMVGTYRGGILATSGVEEDAMRLLGAFYDLSGGKLTQPVPIGGPEMPGEGAAPRADLDPDSTECDIAAMYLVEQGYIEPADATSEYVITVAGLDRVREMRGIGDPSAPAERSGMSDKTQQRLLTLLSIAISIGLSQPLARFIGPTRAGQGGGARGCLRDRAGTGREPKVSYRFPKPLAKSKWLTSSSWVRSTRTSS